MPQELVFALESADELRHLLDRARVDDRAEQERLVGWEAQMLQHWACSVARAGDDYPALSAGLADYANRIEECLSKYHW